MVPDIAKKIPASSFWLLDLHSPVCLARIMLCCQNQELCKVLTRNLGAKSQAKAQLIQARFDHLESRTLAQADLHEGSVDKLQETNRQVWWGEGRPPMSYYATCGLMKCFFPIEVLVGQK